MLRGLALVAASLAFASALPDAQAKATQVDVGVYVISAGNFEVTKGTYTMDFYLWFRWDPANVTGNFTPEKFEIMNGRATTRDRLFEADASDGFHEVWYRIAANLYTDIDFRNYPFDRQALPLLIEDTTHPDTELQYAPLRGESGIDPDVRITGYRLRDTSVETRSEAYPFGETYDRLEFSVNVEKETLGTLVKTLLPIFAFCLVAGLTFLLPVEKLGLRLPANTSMLISAVLFHIAQIAPLPPLSVLTLLDKLMIATYGFLVLSLTMSVLLSVNADYWGKKPQLERRIRREGLALTILAPILAFAMLALV